MDAPAPKKYSKYIITQNAPLSPPLLLRDVRKSLRLTDLRGRPRPNTCGSNSSMQNPHLGPGKGNAIKAQIIADLEGHDDSHDLEGGVLAHPSLDNCSFSAKGQTTILVDVQL